MRSPVRDDKTFKLPYDSIVTATARARPGVPWSLNQFYAIGSSRRRRGVQHTVILNRAPVENLFTIVRGEVYKVSGYMSYNYLYSGGVCLGVLFSTDGSNTRVQAHKLVVCGRTTPSGFTPNFNLEKLGVLMYVADDSSVLAIPPHLESPLIIPSSV